MSHHYLLCWVQSVHVWSEGELKERCICQLSSSEQHRLALHQQPMQSIVCYEVQALALE